MGNKVKVQSSKLKKVSFYKLQGSGNDFLLIDNRRNILKGMNLKNLAMKVCDRHYSVGADGLIAIVPSRKADFKWRFFNADGSEAEMCGNGARCAARFAHIKKIAKKEMSFETLAGIIHAQVRQDTVKVQLTNAVSQRMNIAVPLESGIRMGHFINTGVPHLVYLSKDLDKEDIDRVGRTTRYHELFKPTGTNVNFVQIQGRHRIRIRTYERGVEGETLACGTGSVAAALIAGSLGAAFSPVEIITRGGEKLTVSFVRTPEGFESIHLEGRAEVICEGNLYL
jgi:diaminopimelate epimerase